jgi:hypothetical protein
MLILVDQILTVFSVLAFYGGVAAKSWVVNNE